jgi:hypothetical protein
MAKVKIITGEKISFIEKDGILQSEIYESKSKKFWISINYGNNKIINVGSFDTKEEAENIILNDL